MEKKYQMRIRIDRRQSPTTAEILFQLLQGFKNDPLVLDYFSHLLKEKIIAVEFLQIEKLMADPIQKEICWLRIQATLSAKTSEDQRFPLFLLQLVEIVPQKKPWN